MVINDPTTSFTLSVYLSPLVLSVLHASNRSTNSLSHATKPPTCPFSPPAAGVELLRTHSQAGTAAGRNRRIDERAREATYLVSPLPPLTFPSPLVSGAPASHGFYVASGGNGHGRVVSPLPIAFPFRLSSSSCLFRPISFV